MECRPLIKIKPNLKCKIVSSKEIAKYSRMDAKFYVQMKPDIESFFKNNFTTSDGRIIESRNGGGTIPSEFLKHFTGKDVQLLWVLIKEHYKFEEARKIINLSLLHAMKREEI